jgi:predicted MPP superfamily phosphohydrolase
MFAFFLIFVIALYAGMHAYIYRHITTLWVLPRQSRLLLIALFMLLIALPFAGRTLDHNGHITLARCVNRTAFLWMVWVFWFCMAGWAISLWNVLFHRFRLSPRAHSVISAMFVLVATCWGLVEASRPIHREMMFIAPGLPSGSAPIKIVQVSDVHLGTVRSERWNQSLVKSIRDLAPDLLLSTGDFIDSSVRNVGSLADQWATLKAPLGKYAVLGNHEFYAGMTDSISLHNKAGFCLLRGCGVSINDALFLYGADDLTGRFLGSSDAASEARLPLHGPRSQFTILLKHQPRIDPRSLDRFDLQLSGHTHGGQVFPFHLVTHLIYPLTTGIHDIGKRSKLYVSRGTGTWGPPLRVFAPPEITVITLIPGSGTTPSIQPAVSGNK